MKRVLRTSTGIAMSLLLMACGTARQDADHVVCAVDAEGCTHVGNRALQTAVDAASSGDTILVRAGTYVAEGTRDVPYEDVVVRGYVLIADKELEIVGEKGAVLAGDGDTRASAIVVANGKAVVKNLGIRDFRPADTEDQVYDGHGIFVIDGSAHISSVTFERIEKMAVSLRGDSEVVLENSQMLDGHLGAWTEEGSRLAVRDSTFRNNDSAGIAAYMTSAVTVTGSTFEGNLDDGVFADDNATIDVTDSVFIDNSPYAVRAVGGARITFASSQFQGNASDVYSPEPESPE